VHSKAKEDAMSKQHTRRRRTRCAVGRAIAVGGAVAMLVAILGAGQALASTAQPDERVLERQGLLDRQAAEQGRTEEASRQGPTRTPGWSSKPEPKMDPGPWIDEQAAPDPLPPSGRRPNMAVPVTVAVLLVLALGAAVARWLRHRPRPEATT
jgi:hypothetical protein